MANPQHYVYQDDESTLLYTIGPAIDRDPPIIIDVPDNVKLSNLRANGSITIPGGNKSYDITIRARLSASNYTNLITTMKTLQSTVAVNTNYFLKYDQTLVQGESLESIKVQMKSINFDMGRGKLTTFVYYDIIFKSLSW